MKKNNATYCTFENIKDIIATSFFGFGKLSEGKPLVINLAKGFFVITAL